MKSDNQKKDNVFRNRNFRLVFLGALVSELGAILYSFAVSFYILEISGNNAFLQGLYLALSGIMLLLFGSIASVGIQNLVNHKVNLDETRNIIIVSVVLTLGIGGAILPMGSFSLSGIGLSALAGVILNLVIPKTKINTSNDD